MRLKYKIALIMSLVGMFIISSISLIYSYWSYKEVTANEEIALISLVKDSSHYIDFKLKEQLSITKTIGTAPIVFQTLTKSNEEYQQLNPNIQKKKIDTLEQKWKDSKDINDPFIQKYLNNKLSLYLKSQQKVLPGVYGEIFLTNRYGAMLATTGKLSTLAHAHKYWWQESYNNGDGKVFFDDRGFDKSVKGYVIGVVIPIKKDGEIIGILKANVNIIGTLSGTIKRYKNLNHGKLKIVRSNGLVVLDEKNLPLSTHLDSKLIKDIQTMKTGFKITDTDIIAYTPIELTLKSSKIAFGNKPNSIDHTKGNNNESWHTIIRYQKYQALQRSDNINKMIIYVGIVFIILLFIVALFFGKWLSLPIIKLSDVVTRIGNGEHHLRAEINTKDEVAILAQAFNKMLENLQSTMISRDKLLQEVEKRKKAQIELMKKDEVIISQSRHAAMGEMISMIAHQWRQPLAIIAMAANNIKADIDLNTVNIKDIEENMIGIVKQTKNLSDTIDDFRDFFKPNKSKEKINPQKVIEDTLAVIGKSLQNNNIKVIKSIECSKSIDLYSRELIQVLLNITKNAQEALISNNIEDKKISITLKEDNESIKISVCDNAGGIKDEILSKIFNPYFSTKKEKNGTGLGLYMSKIIVNKHLNGSIKVQNRDDGVCFSIILSLT